MRGLIMVLTVGKIAQVLDLFSAERPEWGVSEAAKELGLPKSSVSELMSSLEAQRLLCRTAKRKYRLGWRLFELSQTLLDTTEFFTEARRVMEDLVGTWKETVHLAVLDGAQAVYVEKLQPRPAVKISVSRTGTRLPAHCSGVGKVLLAHQDWGKISGLLLKGGLPALTPNTITDLDALKAELYRVRERGYAVDDEEVSIGLCCAAAPIHDAGGHVMAAVSLSVPAYRFHEEQSKYIAAILEAAGQISGGVGLGANGRRDNRARVGGLIA